MGHRSIAVPASTCAKQRPPSSRTIQPARSIFAPEERAGKRRRVDIPPRQMLPAGRVIKFIAEISITAIEQQVDYASCEGEANGYSEVLLEPHAPDGSSSARRLQRARLFFDEGSRFFYAWGNHLSSPFYVKECAKFESREAGTIPRKQLSDGLHALAWPGPFAFTPAGVKGSVQRFGVKVEPAP